MKRLIAVVLAFLMCGCASNGYKDFYTKIYDVSSIPEASHLPNKYVQPRLITTNDINKTVQQYRVKGYVVLGYSGFEGGLEDKKNAISQAKEVGATLVILSASFKEQRTINSSMVIPTTNTTTYNGSINNGLNNYGYSGIATTNSMQVIPYTSTQDRYSQNAVFLIRSNKTGKYGVLLSKIPAEKTKSISRNTGAYVDLVFDDTPAYYSNILIGDVITKVNDIEVYDPESFSDAVNPIKNQAVITFLRNGETYKTTGYFNETKNSTPVLISGTETKQATASDDKEMDELIATINSIPLLKKWRDANGKAWKMAMDVDETLMSMPEYKTVSLKNRFLKVVDIVNSRLTKQN